MTRETRNGPHPVHVAPLRIRWLRHLLLLVMLGVAVHLLLPQIANLSQAWQTIRQMPWWAVGLAVLAQLASYGGSGYLLSALADVLNERLSVARGVVITLAGSSIGLVAGGIVGSSAATYRWARASGLNGQAAGLCGTLPPVFNNLLLVSLAVIGLLHLLLIHQLTVLQGISFGFVLFMLALLAGVITWGIMRPDWLARQATRIAGKWAQIRKRPYDPATVASSVNQLVNTWKILRSGGWRGPAIGAMVNIGGDMLTLYFLFVAAGQAISPGVLLTGYGLPLIIAKLGFLPGGVGIVEATMTAIYASLGVPNHVTVVVILGYRLISFWIPTLFGFPLALYLQRTTLPEKPSA